MTGVMSGIRILEVAEHTFVPAAAGILADWGADVVKVEHHERGDAMRGLAQAGAHGFETSVPVLMEHANRGKRSIGLNLGHPDGASVLHRLIAASDVFLTNKLPAVAIRLGITAEDVRRHNPDIVYVRGSGYGSRGPESDAGGYDFLAYWARTGLAEAVRRPDAPPPFPPAPGYGDSIGAMTIAGGIAAALLHRERTGEAHVVDISLLGTGMWAASGAIAVSQLTGAPWEPLPPDVVHGTPSNPLAGFYRTKDDRFIALSMLQGFEYWPDMCARLGLEHLVDDPRFDTVERLMANAQQAGVLVAEAFLARTQAEWAACFAGMRGQWSLVQDTAEVGTDPQAVANGYLQDVALADGTPFRLVAAPVQFSGEPVTPQRGPEFNEHGDEILTELLGLSDDEVLALRLSDAVT